ncbi:23S rRNA (adenine(2503)-C(2))-methyltransferase RlmN [Candidatus Dojkabacteria bacterium]|nr:23S rRNA (adenine(2503)-C(2))-methyltransferase RlmN [Candidatus Dojkabacteria bacterium]
MINKEFIKNHNLPEYKLKQFYDLYYQKAVDSFDEITTWSKPERENLKNEVEFSRLEVVTNLTSIKEDTTKVLFKIKRDPKKRLESVLMRHKDGRNTVCVSCMVGCPVNCEFCATGKMGFQGNLSADEIIDQILFFQRLLKKENQKVTNIVYMGMGEPMLNLTEVERSIEILINPIKFGISQRRIIVSTSGYVTQFEKFIADGFRTKIAISLHASNQALRARLMPVAKQFPLDKLMYSLDNYVRLTNKRISYEYVMLNEINDTKQHARELAYLLHNRLALVNLIPYNPIREANFTKSSKSRIHDFARILKNEGIECTIRVTMGEDIDAACGQLADRENEKYKDRLDKLKKIVYKD